jgi:hypothetical protein
MTHEANQPSRCWELILLTVLLALFQIGAALRALRIPPELGAQISLPMILEFVAAGLWALLFAVITVNLIRGRALRPAVLIISGFVIYSLARLIVFARADYDLNRLPFLVVITVCLLLTAALLLRR